MAFFIKLSSQNNTLQFPDNLSERNKGGKSGGGRGEEGKKSEALCKFFMVTLIFHMKMNILFLPAIAPSHNILCKHFLHFCGDCEKLMSSNYLSGL